MKLILLIDDNDLFRVTMAEWLTLEGFQSVTTGDGMSGLRLAQECQPDLILCDVDMPDMDGLETLRQLRQDANTAHIPLLFLTAGSTLQAHDAYQLGASGLVSKSGAIYKLRNAIHTHTIS
ncbi:response regulator [Leptolyngbya sp. AN02str]|uniref:response regulator n=1 Tax=Leptolyngbya sp. AN02str TaxID=3423363 RepID=UPI003D3233F0